MSWYSTNGPDNDIVISSRVRLARNLKKYPFAPRMSELQRKAVLDDFKQVLLKNDLPELKDVLYVNISEMTPIDRQAMVERHLISIELAQGKNEAAAFINREESVSAMVNEEDHLRLQCILPGMQLQETWKLCDKLDNMIAEKLEYAYNTSYGFLTCCPTNVGTGMRVSAMMHLPALSSTGYINNLLEACGKIGITVRGLHGENTSAAGNIYQVSNQISLGLPEEDIVDNVSRIVNDLINHERKQEKAMYAQDRLKTEDTIYRSYGTLTNARIISTEESLRLLSDIRLGVNLGILKDISVKTLNELLLGVQPATLQRTAGKPLEAAERDTMRAETIRNKL